MKSILKTIAFSLCVFSFGMMLSSKYNIKSLLLLPKVSNVIDSNKSINVDEEEPTYPFKVSKYTQLYKYGKVYNNPKYMHHYFRLEQLKTMSVSAGYIDFYLDDEKENITFCCTVHIDAKDGDFAFDANSIMYFVFTDGNIVDLKWVKNEYGKLSFGSKVNGYEMAGVDARAYFYLGGRDRIKIFLTKDLEKMILYNPDKKHNTTIELSEAKVNKEHNPYGVKGVNSFFEKIVENLESIYVHIMKGHEDVLPIIQYMELEKEIRERNNQQ